MKNINVPGENLSTFYRLRELPLGTLAVAFFRKGGETTRLIVGKNDHDLSLNTAAKPLVENLNSLKHELILRDKQA